MSKLKDLIARYFADLGAGNYQACINAFHPDGVVVFKGSIIGAGEVPIALFGQAMPQIAAVFPEGLHFTLSTMTEEDGRVAIEAESRGRHANGGDYHNQYHFLMVFDAQQRITRFVEYSDTEMVTEVMFGGRSPITQKHAAKESMSGAV